MNTYNWNLSSSSGRDRIAGAFIRQCSDQENTVSIIASMSISGDFWDRSKNLTEADLISDYTVLLPQVLIKQNSVELLISELKEWLNKPKEFSIDLSCPQKCGQSLSISVVKKEGYICSLEKPACTISYTASTFRQAEWSFIVDQSCIRIFLTELKSDLTLLNQLGAHTS